MKNKNIIMLILTICLLLTAVGCNDTKKTSVDENNLYEMFLNKKATLSFENCTHKGNSRDLFNKSNEYTLSEIL